MQYWPLIIFGWPSAIIGLTLQVAGIARRSAGLSVSGAIISLGFCSYLLLSPSPFRWFGIVAIVGNFLSVVAVRNRATYLGTASLAPLVVIVAYLAARVMTQ